MYRHDYLLHGNVHLSMANIAHGKRGCGWLYCESLKLNPLNMLKIKCDINQQYFKTVDFHFVKSE